MSSLKTCAIVSPYIDIHSHSRTPTAALRIVNSDPQQFARDTETLPYLSIGVHPWNTASPRLDETLDWVAEHASHPKVLAIGECGLDRLKGADIIRQKSVFSQQLELAETIGKPIIVHCVRASDLLVQVLKSAKPRVPVIVHGFNQKPEIAREMLRRGVYISFGNALRSEGSNAVNVLKTIPLNRAFLETDDCDVGIEPIYQVAAEIVKAPLDIVRNRIRENFYALFGV